MTGRCRSSRVGMTWSSRSNRIPPSSIALRATPRTAARASRIRQWVVDGAERGRFVFVRIGPRMIALLPGRDVDLGKVDSDDEIVVSRRPGAVGVVYDVEVKRQAAANPASLA